MTKIENNFNMKIWGENWGLPSIDPNCLSVITYAKFSKVPMTNQIILPTNTITGNLPELEADGMVYSDFFSIVGIFRKEGYNADYHLTAKQQADTLAFLAYIDKILKPAILYTLWLDNNNYDKVTRPAYAKLFGFPRSWYYPSKLKEKITNFIHHNGGFHAKDDIGQIVYKNARDCMNVINRQLEENNFFFGSLPTTIDAAIYGYLGLLLRAPLVSTELKNHLLSCDRLTNHCHLIEKYFDLKPISNPSNNFLKIGILQGKDGFLTIGIGISIMVAYAILKGVFTSKSSLLARQLGTVRK